MLVCLPRSIICFSLSYNFNDKGTDKGSVSTSHVLLIHRLIMYHKPRIPKEVIFARKVHVDPRTIYLRIVEYPSTIK